MSRAVQCTDAEEERCRKQSRSATASIHWTFWLISAALEREHRGDLLVRRCRCSTADDTGHRFASSPVHELTSLLSIVLQAALPATAVVLYPADA